MIDHPVTLILSGASIGGTVAYLLFRGRLAATRMRNTDLAARASATGQRVSEQAAIIAHQQATINRLVSNARGMGIIWRKLQTAQEVLNDAAAQNTNAATRKVIADGLERVRCAGETDIDGGAE